MQESPSDTIPAPTPVPPKPPKRHPLARLLTKGTWARPHAISAGALQLYSAPCTLYLLWQALHGGVPTPSAVELATVITLSYIKDITAVPLALRHRRGAEREAMIIASFVDFAVWSFTLYLCAPALSQATGFTFPPLADPARILIFTALALGGVVSTVRPIITATDLVTATKRAAPPTKARAEVPRLLLGGDAANASLYGLVQVIPGWSVVIGSACVLVGGPEMRQWMVDMMPAGYGVFYGTAFCGAAAGSLGVFSATLYSRRIISAAQMSAINAVQISVYLGFLAALYCSDPNGIGEVLRVTQLHPFWLFNETPWLA